MPARRWLLSWLLASSIGGPAWAADLAPWMQGSALAGSLARVRQQVEGRLRQQGFELIAHAAPAQSTEVLLISSPQLRQAVGPRAPWLAVLPLHMSQHGNDLHIRYPHIAYVAAIAQSSLELQAVQNRLALALGATQTQGATVAASKLGDFRYGRGFEGPDDHYELGQYSSQAEAVATVMQGLGSREELIFQRELEQGQQLLGLAINPAGTDALRLFQPYPVLISGGRVSAPHWRYWLALWNPGLSIRQMLRLGRQSEAIEATLRKLVGAQPAAFRF